ncbi:MAG: hypothetical protein KKF06_06105 [Candidatus Margulisbacteria bacterium]|nr:hypothetical protein [Candidatus Margulisiibacteriota bacterium]MBU1867325.1 hypothetical protein [Candidatus Margulisiibacteriota bacterium]
MLIKINKRFITNREIALPNPLYNALRHDRQLTAIVYYIRSGRLHFDDLMRTSNPKLIGLALAMSGEAAARRLVQRARGTADRQKVGLWRILNIILAIGRKGKIVTSRGDLKTTLHYRAEIAFLERLGEMLPDHSPLFISLIPHLPGETKVFTRQVVATELFVTCHSLS